MCTSLISDNSRTRNPLECGQGLWWSRNCKVMTDDSIIEKLLQYLLNRCGYVWRSIILHLCNFINNILLLVFWDYIILQNCCILSSCDEIHFHICGCDLHKKVRTKNECVCDISPQSQFGFIKVTFVSIFINPVNSDLGVSFLVKQKCASLIHNICNDQLLSSSSLMRK